MFIHEALLDWRRHCGQVITDNSKLLLPRPSSTKIKVLWAAEIDMGFFEDLEREAGR